MTKSVIRQVSVEVVPWEHPPMSFTDKASWSTAPAMLGKSELAIIRIVDQDGREGNAFCGGYFMDQDHLDAPIRASFPLIKQALEGKSAFDRDTIWSRIWDIARWRDLNVNWVNAIDNALWDLSGKAAGLPVYQMLGAARHRVQAYASSPFYSRLEEYSQEALRYRERGFRAYKIHPGKRPAREVIALCEHVRSAVGDGMHLMLDCGTDPFGFRDALTVGYALDDLEFHWYEDPLPFQELDNFADLAQRLRTPLALHDFASPRYFPMLNYIQKRAGKFMRADAMNDGITGMHRLAILCAAHGLNLEPHHGHNSLGNAANLQVIFANRNCDFYEHIVPENWGEFGLVEDIRVDSEGYVNASTKPGLGFDVDWDRIKSLEPRIVR